MLCRKGFSLIGISLAPRTSFLPNACYGPTDAFSRPSVVRVGSFAIPAVYTRRTWRVRCVIVQVLLLAFLYAAM
jgi:hypothetical protein